MTETLIPDYTKIRCYNCGLLGHLTQHCPSYGPRFPAPGKSAQDYGDLAQTIANKIARDIVDEHDGHEVVEEEVRSPKGWTKHGKPGKQDNETENRYRTVHCSFCSQGSGDPCRSKTTGRAVPSHLPRIKRYEEMQDREERDGIPEPVDGAPHHPGTGREGETVQG